MLYTQNNSFNLKTINNIKLGALILFVIPIIGIILNLIRLQFLSSLFEALASCYFAYSMYIFALDQNNILRQESMRIAGAFLFLGIFQFVEIFISTNVSINPNTTVDTQSIIRAFNTAVFPAIIMLILVSVATLLGFIWFTQLFNRILNTYNMPESNNLKHAAILQVIGSALLIIDLILLSSLVNQLNTGVTQSSLGTIFLVGISSLVGALLILAALVVQLVAWYKIYKRSGEIEILIQQPFANIPSKVSEPSGGTVNQPSYIQNTLSSSTAPHLSNPTIPTQNENFSNPSPSMLEKPVFCSNCGTKLRGDSKYCPNCGQQIL